MSDGVGCTWLPHLNGHARVMDSVFTDMLRFASVLDTHYANYDSDVDVVIGITWLKFI